MKSFGVGHVARWEIIVQFDIRREPNSSERTFKEIVTQQGILWDLTLKSLLESSNVVDPLADIGSLREEVLVYVGDHVGIWIESRLSREQLRKPRAGG
jgi:hypothetical protein